MQASPVRQQDSSIRSTFSWTRVVLWAGLVAAVLFGPSDWSGCGFYRHGAREFLHFAYVFGWLLIFFWLRMKWRLLLLCFTIPFLLTFYGLNGIQEENAGPEAVAVSELKQIRIEFQDYRHEQQQEAYPESWRPAIKLRDASKFYKFEYVPRRDASGKIVSYLVQATPVRRDCDFYVSFTIADDGKVFYTHEPRVATTGDRFLEQ